MRVTAIYSLVLQALLLRSVEASACSRSGGGQQCNADNCARAATGTFDGKQSLRTSACSSFQQCTVYPATVTLTSIRSITPVPITQVVTVTAITNIDVIPTTITVDVEQLKRDGGNDHIDVLDKSPITPAVTVCPTAVPSTASACSGTSRYDSACSCAGITKSYSTASALSTTITITSTIPQVTVTVPAVFSTVITSLETVTVTPFVPIATTCALRMAFPTGSNARSSPYNDDSFVGLDSERNALSAVPQADAISFVDNNNNNNNDLNLVNTDPFAAIADRAATLTNTTRNVTLLTWDTIPNQQSSGEGEGTGALYSLTQCIQAPSSLSPGSNVLKCNDAGATQPAICDAEQWTSLAGSGGSGDSGPSAPRSEAFIVLLKPGEERVGCYAFELEMVPLS